MIISLELRLRLLDWLCDCICNTLEGMYTPRVILSGKQRTLTLNVVTFQLKGVLITMWLWHHLMVCMCVWRRRGVSYRKRLRNKECLCLHSSKSILQHVAKHRLELRWRRWGSKLFIFSEILHYRNDIGSNCEHNLTIYNCHLFNSILDFFLLQWVDVETIFVRCADYFMRMRRGHEYAIAPL